MSDDDVGTGPFPDDPPPRERGPLFRLIAILVLIAFVLVWVPGVVNGLQSIFGSR